MALTEQQLSDYMATDCATAISQAESAGRRGASNRGAKPAGLDCAGCDWVDGSCIWIEHPGPDGQYPPCDVVCCALE